MPNDLDEEESKNILEMKVLELALPRYMDREDKIKEIKKIIYGLVFLQCTLSIQSALNTCCKGWLDYVSWVGIQIKYMLSTIRGARLQDAKYIKTGCGEGEGELYWLFYILFTCWMDETCIVGNDK